MVNIKQLREAVDELELYRNYGTVDGVREQAATIAALQNRLNNMAGELTRLWGTIMAQDTTIERLTMELNKAREGGSRDEGK